MTARTFFFFKLLKRPTAMQGFRSHCGAAGGSGRQALGGLDRTRALRGESRGFLEFSFGGVSFFFFKYKRFFFLF